MFGENLRIISSLLLIWWKITILESDLIMRMTSWMKTYLHSFKTKLVNFDPTRPSSDSEAATMYKLKRQSSNMQTGQGFKYKELIRPAGPSISFRKTLSELYFTKLNIICYNALNDLRYLNDIDFKDQIQNSQQMVYFILGHLVC